MKKQLTGLGTMILTIWMVWSCNDPVEPEILESSIAIDTRFINNDSISVLDALIDGLSDEITTLNASIESQQTIIDSLNMLISENPEDPDFAFWEEEDAKLETKKEANEAAVNVIQSSSSELDSKRDSLSNGYSFLTSVTNLGSGAVEMVDSLLTTYELALDFNATETTYRIIVGDTIADITLNYSLAEEISVEGRVNLILESLDVTENSFDSLTLTDEDIYIFYY